MQLDRDATIRPKLQKLPPRKNQNRSLVRLCTVAVADTKITHSPCFEAHFFNHCSCHNFFAAENAPCHHINVTVFHITPAIPFSVPREIFDQSLLAFTSFFPQSLLLLGPLGKDQEIFLGEKEFYESFLINVAAFGTESVNFVRRRSTINGGLRTNGPPMSLVVEPDQGLRNRRRLRTEGFF